jgi:hypothetical protein
MHCVYSLHLYALMHIVHIILKAMQKASLLLDEHIKLTKRIIPNKKVLMKRLMREYMF